jgi:hypothetical protein
MMKKPLHGTVFAVPLPDGTYICGRVMLDIYGTLKRRLFPQDSPLPGLGQAYLIEMYSGIEHTPRYVPSPVLIPGAFVESKEVGKSWPIVGHEPINAKSVEFPESLIGFPHSRGQMAFQCGEIRFPLPIPLTEQQRIDVSGTRHSAFLWPFTCLHVMGRVSDVPAEYKMATLEGSDLRISRHRAEIYRHLPFHMEQSYFEKQAMFGLDFERLYE